MIAIREMDDGVDHQIIERDKKILQSDGWMVVMMSRDFHFWTRILSVFADRREDVKRMTIEHFQQAVDEELAQP